MRSKLWTLIIFWITLTTLVASAVTICFACARLFTGGWLLTAEQMAELCLPLLVLALLAWVFRKAVLKSLTVLVASPVVLLATVKSCYPIILHPEDAFFPFMDLGMMDALIFAILVPVLVMAHCFEIIRRRQSISSG